MPLDNSQTPYALAVDDDAMLLMHVSEILADAGFRTLEAIDGAEALRVLGDKGHEVTLLFTDVQMPGGMDGFELARRTSVGWPDIAIVVASGRARPGPGDLPEGARFIAKPFSAEMVHGHLQEILPDGKMPEPLKRKNKTSSNSGDKAR